MLQQSAPYVVYGLIETRPGHRYYGRIRYVGQTKSLDSRIRNYRRGGGNNTKHTNWLKSCPEFDVVVMQECQTLDEVYSWEIALIKEHSTERTDHGLNMHMGGLGGTSRVFSPEHRANISAAKRGIPLTLEHRAKIGAAGKGVPKTEEHARKVGESLRQNAKVVAHLSAIAKNKTPEHQEKLRRLAASKRWVCDECGLRSNAGALATHQKRSEHVGRHLFSDS